MTGADFLLFSFVLSLEKLLNEATKGAASVV